MRIVTLLLAMANLAERAAGAPGFARREVLWALQQADLVTKDYFVGIAGGTFGRHWSPALPLVRYGNAPADALNMASALRALALAVQMMATADAQVADDRRREPASRASVADRSRLGHPSHCLCARFGRVPRHLMRVPRPHEVGERWIGRSPRR